MSVLLIGRINAVADTRIFPPSSILLSERDNYVTVSSSVIHEPENTRQFSFFIVHHVLENQSRGDRKIAVRTDGTSFRSDVKAEKERASDYIYIYVCMSCPMKVAGARFTSATTYDVG